MANELQGSACACLPGAGIPDSLCLISLLCVGAGKPDSGLHTLVACTELSWGAYQLALFYYCLLMSGLG